MSVEMDQFRDLFLQTAREHLEVLNGLLLKLEADPSETGLVEELMRAGHSLKGESGAMGFTQIASLGHVIEDLFTDIGNQSLHFDKALADLLYQSFDQIGASLDSIASGSPELSCEEYINRIKEMTGLTTVGFEKSGEPAPAPAPVPASEPVPAQAPVPDPSPVAGAAEAAPEPAAGQTAEDVPGKMPESLDDIPLPGPQAGGETARSASSILGPTATAAEAVGDTAAGQAPEKVPDAPPAPPAHQAAQQISSVTLKVERLDQIIGISEELVLLKMRLRTSPLVQENASLKAEIHRLDRLVTDLQFHVMQARLFPISMALHTIPRLVRDVASKTNKKVRLEIEGEDTTVDRTIIDHLTEPFVHLVRNAVDHGIESPEERLAAGKPEEAVVNMRSYTKDNKFFVEVSDDGRGIEWNKLAAAAVRKGVITQDLANSLLNSNQQERLLFFDGVSTSEEISDISGRGVGMSAVRSSIKKLGGDISITTRPGQGTTFAIRLPMTLAIMQALLASVGPQIFALPANEIARSIQVKDEDIRSSVGRPAIVVDGREVFLYDLAVLFKVVPSETDTPEDRHGTRTVVLVRRGDELIGCLVDKIVSEEEILVKPLGPLLKHSVNFSGATILADGNAAPIINFEGLSWNS